MSIERCLLTGFRKSAIGSHVNRRDDHSALLTDLRVVDCEIRTIGRMKGGAPDVVFGIGINMNGWDGAYLARNQIENVGIRNFDWAIYCNQTRFATVVENTITDCSGGIAWTSVAADPGFDALSILRNEINLTRARVSTSEAPFVSEHIGVQLRGDGSNLPIQVGVIGNSLTKANIQGSIQNSVIAGNTIDLVDLPNTPGIWVGLYGYDSQNVLISENDIRGEATPILTTGVLVSNGSDIQVRNNRITETAIGIAFGVDHQTGRSGVVTQSEVAHNEIVARPGGKYMHINGANDVRVFDNSCSSVNGVGHGIQVGDSQVSGDNRFVTISGNAFEHWGGYTFAVATPDRDFPLPRHIRIENNTTGTPVVNWPPDCPPGASYTVFVEGDVLQGNILTREGLDHIDADALSNPCYRSGLQHGASNAFRPLQAHERAGQLAYSVLGGVIFTAPRLFACPWRDCATSDADSATSIAWLTNGIPDQVIEIRAVGGSVTMYDQTKVPAGMVGNMHLLDANTWIMEDGNVLHLRCHPDLEWYEFDRLDTP